MWSGKPSKKKKKCGTNVTLAPPKCDKKPSGLFGQKWPFQEVKFLDFNHAIICQSLQSVSQSVSYTLKASLSAWVAHADYCVSPSPKNWVFGFLRLSLWTLWIYGLLACGLICGLLGQGFGDLDLDLTIIFYLESHRSHQKKIYTFT